MVGGRPPGSRSWFVASLERGGDRATSTTIPGTRAPGYRRTTPRVIGRGDGVPGYLGEGCSLVSLPRTFATMRADLSCIGVDSRFDRLARRGV